MLNFRKEDKPLTIYDLLARYLVNASGAGILFTLVGILSLIQIAPIKINPWDVILGWVGSKINAGIRGQLDAVREKSDIQQEEFREFWVDYQREAILRFSRECSQETPHSREEWNHILDIIRRYESFCTKHDIANGVIEENSSYLRDLHKKLLNEHRI